MLYDFNSRRVLSRKSRHNRSSSPLRRRSAGL